jgi:hypothetical protein
MTPWHQSDTLDDHLGHHNWMKTINLGTLFFLDDVEQARCQTYFLGDWLRGINQL